VQVEKEEPGDNEMITKGHPVTCLSVAEGQQTYRFIHA
jgi:hypothetical protein